ncbi:M16 family metallopeptidase [Novosphingobium guangzhouense]|uniref:Peptidase M16 n=1 Tax=Novosphingobium guangzhouense TaxID=1850347 RepID=A0A2K2FX03_9SPHN|nr:insulinase family protein [Novosphingobium guangzhouense]PNU03303.1 peptidase M16 [Novosphingobium guangzhouense]
MKTCLTALALILAATPLAAQDNPRPDNLSWAFETSDVPVDRGFRFGRLSNGMRYVIRHNATPAGTAIVRMDVKAGSLDEGPAERGFAHFLEHMAFNGSRNVPEGEMVPLLEREGLAFGADTNASTTFGRTLYKLDLPRADAKLLGTALMLMRETAGNLTLTPEAVARERGVVMAEMRDRNSYGLRNTTDSMDFFYPGSLYTQRLPIGTTETLNAATAASLRAFYEREYVPAHVTLVVVGDIDVDAVEADIRRRFGDWQAHAFEAQPDAGPINLADRDRIRIYTDPALSERVTLRRHGAYIDAPDTLANREQATLRAVGYAIVNRRLGRLARSATPPFRSAGFGTGDLFETARSTALSVSTVDGGWRVGLLAARAEYRRALLHGFTVDEVAEQVARLRTTARNAAASADTRSNGALAQQALALVEGRVVPTAPQSALERFEAFAPGITPAAVLDAMREEAVPLGQPLIRFEGRKAPEGGEQALRAAWAQVEDSKVASRTEARAKPFAYTAFGTPGRVVSDAKGPLDIRQIRFENGVMLNLRRTDLEKERVRVSLAIDGGDRLNTLKNPRATRLVANLADGGLGRHSVDELQTILAGRSVGAGLASGPVAFNAGAATTPRDLQLQLELLAALITDPGYRPEGEVRYRQAIDATFAKLDATPKSALQARFGGFTSGDDPRFTLGTADDYRALSYARLKGDIEERLAHGAIEIGLVGDFEEEAAIALVARTFGALPRRDAVFGVQDQQSPRVFPSGPAGQVTRHVVHHQGPTDQAIVRMLWPTRDDEDPLEVARLELLHEVMDIALIEQLREALGKAYSPGSSSSMSHIWKGYGYFQVNASVEPAEIDETRDTIRNVIASLQAAPVSEDTLLRARAPMLERLRNALKSNGGWMGLAARAQSEPDRIVRFQNAEAVLRSITANDIQEMARHYLDVNGGMEILVLPASQASTHGA